MAAACGAPITVMETAGEGGAYGMALLAAYTAEGKGDTPDAFLNERVFKNTKRSTLAPDTADAEGFSRYMAAYRKLLEVEKKAVEVL